MSDISGVQVSIRALPREYPEGAERSTLPLTSKQSLPEGLVNVQGQLINSAGPQSAALGPLVASEQKQLREFEQALQGYLQRVGSVPEKELERLAHVLGTEKPLVAEVEQSKTQAGKSAVDIKFDPSKLGSSVEVLYGIMQALQALLQAAAQLSGRMAQIAESQAKGAAENMVSSAVASFNGTLITAVMAVGMGAGAAGMNLKSSSMAHDNRKQNLEPAQQKRDSAQQQERIARSGLHADHETQGLMQTADGLRAEAGQLDLVAAKKSTQIQLNSSQAQVLAALALPIATMGGATQQAVAARHQGQADIDRQDQDAATTTARQLSGQADNERQAHNEVVRNGQKIEESRIANISVIASASA